MIIKPVVRMPLYIVPDRLVNSCEKLMKISFEPISIKRTCDNWHREANNTRKWTPRIEEAGLRIWTCDEGLPFNPEIPLMMTEAYYPDIDDPALPLMGLMHRDKWDMKVNREIREIPKFRSK